MSDCLTDLIVEYHTAWLDIRAPEIITDAVRSHFSDFTYSVCEWDTFTSTNEVRNNYFSGLVKSFLQSGLPQSSFANADVVLAITPTSNVSPFNRKLSGLFQLKFLCSDRFHTGTHAYTFEMKNTLII